MSHDYLSFIRNLCWFKNNISFLSFTAIVFPDFKKVNDGDYYLENKYQRMQEDFFSFFISLDDHRQKYIVDYIEFTFRHE